VKADIPSDQEEEAVVGEQRVPGTVVPESVAGVGV